MTLRACPLAFVLTLAACLCLPTVAFAHPGPHERPRGAPDNQTEPLEPGTKPDIPEAERVAMEVRIVDADTGGLLPHRVRILDGEGKYYPPEGHVEIDWPEWHTHNVSLEPDVSNRKKAWAMIESGQFTVHLRARDGQTMLVEHGLEYERAKFPLNLAGEAGKTLTRTFKMPRGINMRSKGWMSADTHVHNLAPLGALRQMKIEGIDYVNLMFIGPGHVLLRRGFVTGKPADVSTKDHIVYVSQEVRDANQGHMTLLGMREPIRPIQGYTGRELDPNVKVLPNEPLNWEVWEQMHRQGGLAFHAHYLFWPGYGSAASAALGKLDGVEWLCPDIVVRGSQTRQNIVVPGFRRTGGGAMWYYMLNCGAKVPLIGGTDKMSAARVLGCTDRTYAKVASWDHPGFMDALRDGATFVTNGPLLDLAVDGKAIGSDLNFTGPGPFTVKVEGTCFTQRPIKYLHLIKDGQIIERVEVKDGQKSAGISRKVTFDRSGWLALRAGHTRPDPENWENTITAGHTGPIYVTLNGRLPADKASAAYLVARLDATVKWAREVAVWSSEESKAKALEGFREARAFYAAALKRATEEAK